MKLSEAFWKINSAGGQGSEPAFLAYSPGDKPTIALKGSFVREERRYNVVDSCDGGVGYDFLNNPVDK
ncbi:MAG: hypothetical protein M1378_13660 [Bacteroidetes bacterium]|jgi:hypothetical protein|nr:hypothetical protein [Bacteroidota bacterium]